MIKNLPLKKLHAYTGISVIVFIAVQLVKYYKLPAPDWVFFYLNDFLAIPIVATICLHAVWLVKKDRSLRLGPVSIISLVVMFSVYFEYYLPRQSYRHTGDPWDLVCYALGGLVFYFLQRSR